VLQYKLLYAGLLPITSHSLPQPLSVASGKSLRMMVVHLVQMTNNVPLVISIQGHTMLELVGVVYCSQFLLQKTPVGSEDNHKIIIKSMLMLSNGCSYQGSTCARPKTELMPIQRRGSIVEATTRS